MTRTELPQAYREFTARFPKLGQAWDLTHEAASDGPLDERTARLLKLAISMAAMREGAVHSGVRKALAAGASPDEILQVVALLAGTIGFASTVAVYTWVQDILAG